MAKTDTSSPVRDLAKKGDGVLVKRGSVWSYPGAPFDGSGTNLQLPAEYVQDSDVQALLASGGLVPVTRSVTNDLLSVRLKGDDEDEAVVISTSQAGTAEAATEAPTNYRPTHDAGTAQPTPAEAADAAAANIDAALKATGDAKPADAPQPAPAAPAKAAAPAPAKP